MRQQRRALSTTGALDPGTLSNLELRLSADSLVGADGDPIATWADTSGNSRDATGSGISRPFIGTGTAFVPDSPTGRRGAAFDYSQNDNLRGGLPGSPGLEVSRGFTFYFWFHQSQFGITNQTIWEDDTNGPGLIYSNSSSFIGYGDHTGEHVSAVLRTEGFHFLVWVFSPPIGTGIATVYQDGVLLLTVTPWDFTNSHGPQAGYTLGNNRNLNAPYAGTIYDHALFSEAHSPAIINRVAAWGQGFWGF